MTKDALRKEYKKKRASLNDTEKKEKSANAQKLFLKSDFYKNSRCLMVYMALGNETLTDDIIRCALFDKKTVVLPVTDEKTGEITPCIIDENTEYTKGAFGIREPKIKTICPKEDIDIVLIPGVAYDSKGNRMGFGKGCYDMFLKEFCGVKIGFCYDFQIAEELPHLSHDIPMDYIICDKMIIDCQ